MFRGVLVEGCSMSASVDPLVVGRVIGDVVDMFVPTGNMSVYFGHKHVTNGCDIRPSAASDPPTISISGQSHYLYTLVMTDPDAPSPSEPTLRECLHWVVVDIPGGTDPNQGKEIVPYVGPRPPVGIHRHIIVLFEQKAEVGGAVNRLITGRTNFHTRRFARELDLGLPVAATYFNSQKEPAARRR